MPAIPFFPGLTGTLTIKLCTSWRNPALNSECAFSRRLTKPSLGSPAGREWAWKCRLQHPAFVSTRVFRVSGFEKVLIFYRLGRDCIEIIRVVHGAQDLEALFERDEPSELT